MNKSHKFRYSRVSSEGGLTVLRPMLTLRLLGTQHDVETSALVDSGSDVNILPYSVGEALGIDWYGQPIVDPPAGNLARFDGRGLVVNVAINDFEPKQLGFVWLKTDRVRAILGQFNFFMVFNVCFFLNEATFELSVKE